jgi:phosphatidylserine decarboxylase
MRIPLTRYGLTPMIMILAITLATGGLCALFWPGAAPWPQLGCAILLGAGLAFFRDPQRSIPDAAEALLSPADGKITDITRMDENEFINGPACRIGIFLSVFDVHVNRSPCAGTVSYIHRHAGACHNALNYKLASSKNQAVSLGLDCPGHPAGKVKVKQITGAIARRIVCPCRAGQTLAAGERYGMIRFGSRAEVFVPDNPELDILVQPGDPVRGGLTVLARYRPIKDK